MVATLTEKLFVTCLRVVMLVDVVMPMSFVEAFKILTVADATMLMTTATALRCASESDVVQAIATRFAACLMACKLVVHAMVTRLAVCLVAFTVAVDAIEMDFEIWFAPRVTVVVQEIATVLMNARVAVTATVVVAEIEGRLLTCLIDAKVPAQEVAMFFATVFVRETVVVQEIETDRIKARTALAVNDEDTVIEICLLACLIEAKVAAHVIAMLTAITATRPKYLGAKYRAPK